MSANEDDIRVRIAADLADINKALQQLRRETKATGRDAKDSSRDWSLFGKGLDGIRRQVVQLGTAYLSFRGLQALVRGVIQNTVEAQETQAQLAARINATGGAAGFGADQLIEFATELQRVTTFGDEAIVSLQTLLLGFTNIRGDQFTQATEAALDLATALKTDLESAATTLGRALNDPVRGLQALSRAGITFFFSTAQREQIKQLVETNQLAAAQTLILEELEGRFGGAAEAARDTFGGALAALQNAFGDLLEGGGGGLTGATRQINELTNLLQDPQLVASFDTLVTAVLTAAEKLARAAQKFVEVGQGLGVFIARAMGSVDADDQFETLNNAIARNADEVRVAEQQWESFWRLFPNNPGYEAAREQLERLRSEATNLQESLSVARNNPDAFFQAGTGGGAGGRGGPKRPTAATTEVVQVQVDPREALKQLQSSLAAARVLLDDEIKRVGAALERDFEQNLVRFSDYFGQRAELERQAIEQELEQRRTALQLLDAEARLAAERGEETEDAENNRRKLVAEITALERQRGDVAVNAANRQADAERQLARQLEQVRTRLLELQGDAVGARQAALQQEFEELLKRLSVEGDTAGVELVNNLINVELARTRLEQLQDDYERTMSALSRAEQRVQIEVDTGVISEREGRRRIIELHKETATEVERLIPLMRELAIATGDPAAIERIEEIELALEELGKTAKVAANEMKSTFRDAGEGALASFIDQTRSASEAWDDFVGNIRRKVAQLLSEKIIDRLFAVLGGIGTGGTGGGSGGGIGNFFASLFHSGGVVGLAGAKRRLSALAALEFAGAPRLHAGGLASNEVPAILERGEEVLTRRDPRHRMNGGRGGDTINLNLSGPDAHRVLRENRRQIEADAATILQRSRNRNGA